LVVEIKRKAGRRGEEGYKYSSRVEVRYETDIGTRLYHHSSTTHGHFYAALISGTGTKLSSLTNHTRLTGKIPLWFDTSMTAFPSLMVVLTTL
jgi:hypothetical protein